MPPSKKKQAQAQVETPKFHVVDGEVKFPERKLKEYVGVDAITASDAKGIMGWHEESETNKFLDGSWQLKDENLNKVRCLNNLHNRPYDDARARRYAQEILSRNWHFNGETIIVGRYGNVLSGQHRLIGLILASQIWAQPGQKEHWAKNWEKEPVMECAIYYGIDETPEVIRTLDNVMPRTLTDILFSQPEMQHYTKAKERKEIAKITEWAIRYLWSRTGDKKNGARAFNPFLTPSEALEFLHNHPKLIKCVDHIYNINHKIIDKRTDDDGKVVEKSISNILAPFATPGLAAGMLYLMSTYGSDGAAYRALDVPNESILVMDYFDKACELWTKLTTPLHSPSHNETLEIRRAIGRLGEGDETIKAVHKQVILAKAWKLYADYEKPEGQEARTPFPTGSLDLVFSEYDDRHFRTLLEYEDFGGIDLGSEGQRRMVARNTKADTALDGVLDTDDAPSEEKPDVLEARKARIQKEREDKDRRMNLIKERAEARRVNQGRPNTRLDNPAQVIPETDDEDNGEDVDELAADEAAAHGG